MKEKRFNILLSSDDNYARHMGAVILSTLQHNVKDFEEIHFYIVNNNISVQNLKNLDSMIAEYPKAKLHYIDFSQWASQLKLNLCWQISMSAYGRLFLGEMLPCDIHRIIYLDCDMIVCQSLLSMWQTEMGDFAVGAIQDQVNDDVKGAVGLEPKDKYFNSGMLLINLDKWRNEKLGEKCLKFINDHNGQVLHHDQGTLNGVLRNKWFRLPLCFNIMTVHYIFNQKQILGYFKDHADFYPQSEIDTAKRYPVILHFTPSFTTRPWVRGCVHPKKNLYWETFAQTPWKDVPADKDNRKWYVKLIEWKCRTLYKG